MNYVKDVCTKVLGLGWKGNKSSKFTINILNFCFDKDENPIKHCYIDELGYLYDDEGLLTLSLRDILGGGNYNIEKEQESVPFYDCPVSKCYYYVDKDAFGNLRMNHTCNDRTVFDLMCKKTYNMFKTRDLPSEQMKDVVKSLEEN